VLQELVFEGFVWKTNRPLQLDRKTMPKPLRYHFGCSSSQEGDLEPHLHGIFTFWQLKMDEHGPFIDDLPIETGDVRYHRVHVST